MQGFYAGVGIGGAYAARRPREHEAQTCSMMVTSQEDGRLETMGDEQEMSLIIVISDVI